MLSSSGVKTGRYIREEPPERDDPTAVWAEEANTARVVPTLEPAPSDHASLQTGSVIDRYIVIEHIGAGGLGDVYSAYDPELDRKVAIKLLKPISSRASEPGLGDPTARLLREAQAMARLRHPNVVTIYDVGTTAGQIFLAMEFVNGQTLSRWARAKPRQWP